MPPPTELPEAIVGSLIVALGLVSIAFAAMRLPSRDRAPVWFGVFACLYGVRLAGRSELVQLLFPLPGVFWGYLDSFITYSILVPAALFIESLFGPGWRFTLHRTPQVLAVYAALAIVHDLVRQQPGATLWLNALAVVIAGGIATPHVLARWRRERWPREFRVAAAGGLIFSAAALYATLGGPGLLGDELEPFAMLVFVTSVGYLVARRMLASERRLVAVSRELDLARQIQQSILPRAMPEVAGLRVAACYLPMSDVAGDFYDFDARQANHLGVLVADVSGHGVPAALVAAMVKVAFAAAAERLETPGLALETMNRTLCGKFERAYVTACCGSFDAVNRRLKYSSAGHPPPLLRRADGRVERLDQGGLALTFDPNAQYPTAQVELGPGDRIVFFTDGLVEAWNASDEFFGEARLEELVAVDRAVTPGELVEKLIDELRRWTGPDASLQDDVTVVVVDISEK